MTYSSPQTLNNKARTILTGVIVGGGLAILILLSWIVISRDHTKGESILDTSKWVFNAIIPLIASWVGTVIAFYFGRDNYEAATEQVLALSRETLDDLSVENMMINVKTIVSQKIDQNQESTVVIKELIDLYKKIEKDRIPIFSSEYKPRYIIHRSSMIDFHAENQKTDGTLSLKEMLDLNPKKFRFEEDKGFVTLSKNISVFEAKKKMEAMPNCRDAFVTEDGTPNTEVIGWLTDTLISRFLDVKTK